MPVLVLRAIRRVARRFGTPVYLVGGPLRDVLLSRPAGDIDIAVEGDAARFGKALARELRGTFKGYQQFGTGTVLLNCEVRSAKCELKTRQFAVRSPQSAVVGGQVDVARTRTETYVNSAALPRVRAADIRADLRRRDFTINAMAWRLATGRGSGVRGQGSGDGLIDPFNGQDDLRRGVIRVLHAKSFEDDPTRIFRAVRFAVRFGFRIEPGTLSLMNRAIREGRLKLLSGKRVMTELELVMQEPNPGEILAALNRLGAFSSVFGQWLKRDRCVNVGKLADPALRLLYVLSGLEIRPELPLTREQIADMVGLRACPELQARLKRATRPSRVSQVLKSLTRNALRIQAALLSGGRGSAREKILAYLDKYSQVRPLLTGQDFRALGIEPGPIYSELLNRLLAARLDGKVKTRKDEEKLVKKLSGSKRARERESKTRGDCRMQNAECRVQNDSRNDAR